MERELYIPVLDYALEKLTIVFEERRSGGFGFRQCLANGPPEKVWQDRAVDPHE